MMKMGNMAKENLFSLMLLVITSQRYCLFLIANNNNCTGQKSSTSVQGFRYGQLGCASYA